MGRLIEDPVSCRLLRQPIKQGGFGGGCTAPDLTTICARSIANDYQGLQSTSTEFRERMNRAMQRHNLPLPTQMNYVQCIVGFLGTRD